MRHRVTGKKLNRDIKHRRALYKNLITSLIVHGQINTTEAKAKVIRGKVDKLFTKAKKGTLHHRRQIDSILNSRQLTNKLVDELAPKTKRNSGYTRITRLGRRGGDNTVMARLEFVDKIISSPKTQKKEKTKSKTTVKITKNKTATNKTNQKKTVQKTKKTIQK